MAGDGDLDVFLLEDKTKAHGERKGPLLPWEPLLVLRG